MSDFYLTLPSHSSKNEYPDNTSNHFKIRLPHPIRLEGSGWKVGLSAVSLPDTQVSLPPLVTTNAEVPRPILAKYEWLRINGKSSTTKGVANFDGEDLKRVFHNVDGIGFMKSMMAFFQQRRIYNDNGPRQGATYLTDDGKKTYVDFYVEGDDLVIDNRSPPRIWGNDPDSVSTKSWPRGWVSSCGTMSWIATSWDPTSNKSSPKTPSPP